MRLDRHTRKPVLQNSVSAPPHIALPVECLTACGTRGTKRRRGVLLVLVVLLMAMTAGLLALLAGYGAQLYRTRQVDRAQAAARAVLASAGAYVDAHRADWLDTPPTEPIALDVSELVGPNMTASATLAFVQADGERVCHVTVHVEAGRAGVAETVELPLDGT